MKRFLPKAILLNRFCDIYGYTRDAVMGKIRNGVWQEGKEYLKAPDGKLHIIEQGYLQWVYSAAPLARRHVELGYFDGN